MAAARKRKSKRTEPAHRGRIQAQGGGIEKSVSWSRQIPPTESEMMAMVAQLESKLTPAERRDRQVALQQLRQFIHNAAKGYGMSVLSNSYPYRTFRGIRVDLEVLKGRAAVPDSKSR
jgi:hypothetical protein